VDNPQKRNSESPKGDLYALPICTALSAPRKATSYAVYDRVKKYVLLFSLDF
jgi:hypothetical protein